jgi:hypothetical protein
MTVSPRFSGRLSEIDRMVKDRTLNASGSAALRIAATVSESRREGVTYHSLLQELLAKKEVKP